MPFQQDVAFADAIGGSYGKYHSTFRSQGGQVVAHLFERSGWLVAHVYFPGDPKPEDVTDTYLGDLKHYAASHDFEGRLRIIYSE